MQAELEAVQALTLRLEQSDDVALKREVVERTCRLLLTMAPMVDAMLKSSNRRFERSVSVIKASLEDMLRPLDGNTDA